MKEEKKFHLLSLVHHLEFRMLWQGILIGIAGGLVASLYRFLLSYAEKFSQWMYGTVKGNPWMVVCMFLGLIAVGIFVGFLTKWQPMIKGSGIPQVEGQVLGLFRISWWKVLFAKMLGGGLSLMAGLSLGREGPSIQLGAAAGEGVSKALHRDETEKRYLLTCGASAGLAAAFNAPLAGVMFSLEEVHKNFSVGVLVSALASAVTADCVSKLFFGTQAVFGGMAMSSMPLSCYAIFPILGILLGICGWIYNRVLLCSQDIYKKLPVFKGVYLMVIPFVVAGIVGLCMPQILGGGHGIITAALSGRMAISYLALLLVCKFLFSMISFGSGAPGGIFFPLLVLGALVGAIFGQVCITYFGLGSEYYINFIFLGMVGMFTGIVRAPLTGIILIVEMSGSFTQMLDLSIVAVFAYLTADLLGSKPIYESLLERIKPNTTDKTAHAAENVLLNFTVQSGSAAEEKRIGEIPWSKHIIPVSVVRGKEELLPTAEVALQTGDYVMVLCGTEYEEVEREMLSPIFQASI